MTGIETPRAPDTLLGRIVAVFTNPQAAMEAVRENPRWTVAGLILIVLLGFYGATTLQISGPEQLDVMSETRLGQMMTPEQLQEQYDSYLDLSFTDRLLAGMQAGIGVFIGIMINALILLLFTKLAGGIGSFAQVMGVVFWANLIGMGLGTLVKWPLVFAKNSVFGVSTGLALLAPQADPTTLLYQVLSIFDVFAIWALYVIAVGFVKIHGFTFGKALTVTVMTWVLLNAIMVGFSQILM